MSLLHRFKNYIATENLFQKKDRLIVAVSGGVDSIVLCKLCHQANFSFEIAHCNFQLRGAESKRDEAFVSALGEKYNIKVFIKKFGTKSYAEEHKVTTQVAARELRYKWFDELMALEKAQSLSPNESEKKSNKNSSDAQKLNSTFLLTAHHANDSIETLLMNFFKGTGIKGLHGILPKQGKIVRPLLFAKKEELISFANENNLLFVEDSSNASDKYTRNYFRNQIISSLQTLYPRVDENLLGNIERFKDIETLYGQAIQLHKKNLLEYKGDEVHIPVLKLLKAKPSKTIIYEIIKDFGFTTNQVKDVLHLLVSETGKYINSATHKIIRNRKWIIITPQYSTEVSVIVIAETDSEINFEMGKIKIEKQERGDAKILDDQTTAMLDTKYITFPLLLRKWKQGDYFYSLGMQKKKKIGKLLNDLKISLPDKEKIWVIESDKRIIWVVGKRIDDRFKVTNQTEKILKIRFTEP
ncbi:MAG: tRNA lysidine(34) synthetase TilS [Bacteroidota bacterium]|nr:tRNA lysidine(34) synthetase TilS [Bacteroidota bacterium]